MDPRNFNMKKDFDNITKLGPEVRFQRLNSFLNTLKKSEAAREDFNNWQMEIADMLNIKGNVLRQTTIFLNNHNEKVDFSTKRDTEMISISSCIF